MPRDPNSYTGAEFEEDDLDDAEDRPGGEAGDPAAVLDAPAGDGAHAEGRNEAQAAEHRLEGTLEQDLEQDLERTRHVLGYIESVSGEHAARQLAGVMRDSRSMTGVRQMRGDATAYAGDTHEQYVQCILDLPATIEAKQAMSTGKWDEHQLEEAVLHEVNRMGYRLHLEIRDRFMNQFDHRRGIVRFAENRGVAGELLEMIDFAGGGKEHWVRSQRDTEAPVLSKIESAANLYAVEIGLVSALEERDHDAVRDFVTPIRGGDELRSQAGRAMAHVPPEDVELIGRALEIASHWTDEQIRDGALDYHARYAQLDYRFSNDARERWLDETGQLGQRSGRAGDCAARALNEAGGGENYAQIWQEITRGTQSAFPEKDADMGVSNLHFRDAYQEHGMRLLLARSHELNHLMRKHLDLREIPALLEGVLDENAPLTYIACSDGHAVAVVEGTVHDTWDSRMMGDPEKSWKDGKLVELWLKTDDQEVVEGALDILGKYETVRQYDDVLTYGRRRRETIPPPTPGELLEA